MEVVLEVVDIGSGRSSQALRRDIDGGVAGGYGERVY
jgi:hypothetical protein